LYLQISIHSSHLGVDVCEQRFAGRTKLNIEEPMDEVVNPGPIDMSIGKEGSRLEEHSTPAPSNLHLEN